MAGIAVLYDFEYARSQCRCTLGDQHGARLLRERVRHLARVVRFGLDRVYDVDDTSLMPTVVQSCRLEREHAALIARQAKRRKLEASTLSSLYLKEKALEEEYPGIGFRDSVAGREAFVLGHRVAVWEVVETLRAVKTIARTASHLRWPPALVRSALAFAKAFPSEIEEQRRAEIGE